MKKFKFWCKGTSENSNFNKAGWWTFNNVILRKYYGGMDIFESPDFEVCQWTGLVDKNGVEIYEGDIVQYYIPWNGETVTRLVKYDKNFVGFMLGDKTKSFIDLRDILEMKRVLVIGNKFENPELLK